MAQPTVSAGLVTGLVRYVSAKGADASVLCHRAGLKPEILIDPDARQPLASYVNLMREAKAATGDQALALHYAEAVLMSEVSIVGLIMEASATIGDAYLQMRRYGRLAMEIDTASDEARFELVIENDRLYLVDRLPAQKDYPELTEAAFAWLICGPRRFLDRSPVLSVQIAYPSPSHRAEYERVFQCPIEFEASRNALQMHPEALTWRVAQNPSYVFGMLTERADALLASLDATRTTTGRLRAVLAAVLHQGEISAEAMAHQLGFSRQTLFRRLREEGTTYSQVLTNLRRQLAIEYLKAGKVSANETAYLVGFSDAAAFSRAFKRWTGQTPGEFRSDGIR
jgi:AraC-like DNA-binding protein